MTYNGWTNYETWMINLHFDGCFEPNTSADEIKDTVQMIVEEQSNDSPLINDIINSCLDEVNWDEIASHYQEEEEAA